MKKIVLIKEKRKKRKRKADVQTDSSKNTPRSTSHCWNQFQSSHNSSATDNSHITAADGKHLSKRQLVSILNHNIVVNSAKMMKKILVKLKLKKVATTSEFFPSILAGPIGLI